MKCILCGFVVAFVFGARLEAQTTLRIQWDPNDPSEGVISYNLYVDAAPALSVANVLTASCNCIQALVPFTTGSHTIKLSALAPLLSTDPSALIEGPWAIVSFTLNPGSQIKNIKITK
jgi:hypothetical protein